MAIAKAGTTTTSTTTTASTTTIAETKALLWTAQALLAGLFLFAGGIKLVMPADALTQGSQMSAGFLRFIGVAELFGAVGLILPSWLGIHPGLTPLAAAGLVVIMVGAVITSVPVAGLLGALIPLVTGIVAGYVAYGRWCLAPVPTRG